MQAVDEFLHNLKFAAAQQTQDYAPFVYGHIANYDPKTHRVRVVLPSVRNEDDVPVLTSWMPLSSIGAGAGWGVQIAPLGGATTQNPTGGELVAVMRFDRHLGVGVSASMIWNQVNVPPGTALNPGEILLQSKSGASILLDKSGNVTVQAGAGGAISLGDVGGTVQQLVTAAMVAFFNAHTHPGNNQPPSQTMGSAQLTTAVKAE
jgi:hypothetical protein